LTTPELKDAREDVWDWNLVKWVRLVRKSASQLYTKSGIGMPATFCIRE